MIAGRPQLLSVVASAFDNGAVSLRAGKRMPPGAKSQSKLREANDDEEAGASRRR